jgi:hypothetical protein
MQEKTERLSHFAKQVRLQLNIKKTAEISFNTQTQTKLLVDGNKIQVDKFVYLGTITGTEHSTQKDIKKKHKTFKSKNSMK